MSTEGYLSACLGLVCGCLLYFVFSSLLLVCLLLIAILLIVFTKKQYMLLAGLLLIFLVLGSFRTSIELRTFNAYPIVNSQNLLVEGMINSTVKTKNGRSYFFLKSFSSNGKPVSAFLFVSAQGAFNYGDFLRFRGSVKEPKGDFKKYLFRKRVRQVCYLKTLLSKRATAYSLVGRIQSFIKKLFKGKDQPQALLLASLVGDKSSLSNETMSNFKASGLAHLWAVSGLHVGCLALFVLYLSRLFGVRPSMQVALVAFSLVVYAFLTGLNPPVIRATIMGLSAMLTWLLGRRRNVLASLALAFLIMVLYDPLVIYEAGFQLSYAAVLGIVLFSKRIEGLLWDWPSFLKQAFSIALSAQLFTTPVLYFNFGSVPLYSVIANCLAVPMVFPMMVLNFSYVLMSAFPPAVILKTAAKVLAGYILTVASLVSSLPLSRLYLEKPLLIVLLLAMLAAIMLLRKYKQLSLATAIILIISVVLAGCLTTQIGKPGGLTFQFFDVGQGDSCYITNGQRNILVDGGPDYDLVADKLADKGIAKIDIVILSHPNADHLTGLVKVVKNFKIGLYVDPGFPQPSYLYRELLTEVKTKHIKYMRAERGKSLKLGSFKIDFLNPPEKLIKGTSSDDNNNSVVLTVQVEELRALLTGDIEEETEELLLNSGQMLKADFLKVAHHGSAYSNTNAFLKAVSPDYAVISVGENDYGHPAPSTLSRLKKNNCKVLRTDLNGTITFPLKDKEPFFSSKYNKSSRSD